MEKGDQGYGATSRRWETSAGCKFPVPGGTRVLPKCEPRPGRWFLPRPEPLPALHLPLPVLHACASLLPSPSPPPSPVPPLPPPCPWRAHTPCSSLLRNLFHFLNQDPHGLYPGMCSGAGRADTRVCQHCANPQVCELGLHTWAHTYRASSYQAAHQNQAGLTQKQPPPEHMHCGWHGPGTTAGPGCQSSPSTVGAGPCMFSKHLGVPGTGGPCVPVSLRVWGTDSSQLMPRSRDCSGDARRARARARGS